MTEDKWYLINDSVLIHEGEIFANPFEIKFPQNPSLIWLVENYKLVERVIEEVLVHARVKKRGVDIGDCFQHILDRFTVTEEDNSYNTLTPLLHNEMDLPAYCIMRVRKLTYAFARQFLKEQEKCKPFLTYEEMHQNHGVNLDTLGGVDETPTDKAVYQTEEWRDADLLFSDLCEMFTEYFFVEKGYIAFDIEKYFTYMYFHNFSEMLGRHMKAAAKASDIHFELLSLITSNLKQDVENENHAAVDILSIIRELHREQKETGWKPRLLR